MTETSIMEMDAICSAKLNHIGLVLTESDVFLQILLFLIIAEMESLNHQKVKNVMMATLNQLMVALVNVRSNLVGFVVKRVLQQPILNALKE